MFNALPMSWFILAVSLRFVRSMNNVPAFRLSQPSKGQPRISDFATKRAGQTALREYTSNQETWLAASITRCMSGAGVSPR